MFHHPFIKVNLIFLLIMNIKMKKATCPYFCKKTLFGVLSILFAMKCVDGRINKPAVSTIKSEDGDIVDCVDIYSQPAFDHPLLKNHTIQFVPSIVPTTIKRHDTHNAMAQQIWKKYGRCPEGTIPIQRLRNSSKPYVPNGEFSNCKVEIAQAELHRETYIGARGDFNVWNLNVEQNEWSLNTVTVFNKHDSFMETGWAVSPILYGDVRPRIFINWLDTAKDHGCFNLRCEGFVQTSNEVLLGGALEHVSQHNGDQYSYDFFIFKDNKYAVWWAYFENKPIGYWPMIIFNDYGDCRRINWGGSICNAHVDGLHTTTEMGSGVLPRNGYRRSSYIGNIVAINSKWDALVPNFNKFSASCSGCYSLVACDNGPPMAKGACIYYGGPGGRKCNGRCKK